MPIWARFLLAIIIAVVLSVLFPVGGFWAILSLLILFGIFEGLARIFPKYGHWLVVLLAAILVINFGVVRIISDHFKKNMPLTSEALARRQAYEDRRMAEKTNPPALLGKDALYAYKKNTDDIEGEKLQKELGILQAKRKAGTFIAPDAIKEKEILAKIEALEKWYRELTPDSDKNLEQAKLNTLAPTIFVWILGAIGLGVLILGGVLKNKALNGVGGLLIFLAIGIWAYQAVWPSVSGGVVSARQEVGKKTTYLEKISATAGTANWFPGQKQHKPKPETEFVMQSDDALLIRWKWKFNNESAWRDMNNIAIFPKGASKINMKGPSSSGGGMHYFTVTY